MSDQSNPKGIKSRRVTFKFDDLRVIPLSEARAKGSLRSAAAFLLSVHRPFPPRRRLEDLPMTNAAPCPTCTRPIDDPQACQDCGKVTCTDCAMYSEDGEQVWCDDCGEKVAEEITERNREFLASLTRSGPDVQDLLGLCLRAVHHQQHDPPAPEDGEAIVTAAGPLLDALAAHSPLYRATQARAEAEASRLRGLEEAVRLLGLKWSQQAAYLQLAHSRQEGDAVEWSSNLDKMQWQMFCQCADDLRAVLAAQEARHDD